MANLKLGSSDIKALLATYESKQRQLQFELDQTKKMIRSFKTALPELEAAEAAQMASLTDVAVLDKVSVAPVVAPKRKRGRPAGVAAKKNASSILAEKQTKKKSSKQGRSAGYRLSSYDQLVFKALEVTGTAMINSEIVAFIEADQKSRGETADADHIQTMVVRSLQKLANRRDDILKVPYEGRGRAYALPAWVNSKGDLKRKYSRK